MVRRYLKIASNPHFWAIVVLLVIGLLLQYPQQLLGISTPSVFSFLGLTRHAVERILMLLPVSYAAFVFGPRVGLVYLAIASAIMLPRVFLISEYFPDAMFETIGVIIIGVLINLWCHGYRKEREYRQRMLSELESAHRQLQHRTATLEENEKRLAALNKISNTISQFLEPGQILNSAVSSVADVIQSDATWIYLMNQDNTELALAAHRGTCEEPARMKVGDGLSGGVAASGQPLFVGDLSQDARVSRTTQPQIQSVLIVPLNAKGRVNGTLGVGSRGYRSFHQGEIEMLIAIGHQIDVAMDNARLYQRQQEVAAELRVSEQRYRELFENAHDAIWVHDLDGNITTANRATEALGGYSLKELIGMNVRIFLTEESLNLAGQIKRKLFQGETVEQPYEQHLVRRDGTVAILQLTTNLISENGKPAGFLHIARDVTREKEMQDKLSVAYRELGESLQQLKESQEQLIQAEKLTSLGQLAASVAHEVNNPLSGILIYTQLLMKKIASDSISKETVLDYLSKMESELIRSTKLIRNLLDFARQSPPAFRQVNINDVISRAFDLAAHSAQLQQVRVVKALDPSLPEVTADSDQLQQVFTNLILNAIQAMSGGGQLTLRTSVEHDQLKAEVKDTGHGISPENMRKLFTPFFTTKREVKGVGLGLAVAYGIVQRHKGRIEVQSQEGEGTTFTIYLPLRTG